MTSKTVCYVFNGPAGSGKDTLASHIAGERISIAEGVRIGAAKYFKYPGLIAASNDRNLKDLYNHHLGMTPRQALIHYSEDIAKPQYGDNVFIHDAIVRILPHEVTKVTDMGFQHELDLICEAVDEVYLIKLYRDGCTFEGDSRNYVCGALHRNCKTIHIQVKEGEALEQSSEILRLCSGK